MKKIIPLIYILLLVFGKTTEAQTYQLWGTTYWGGLNNGGVIMYIDEQDLPHYAFPYSFGTPTGEFPKGNLVYGKDSIFYGLTTLDGADSEGVLFSYDPVSQTYTDLVDFDSTNGSYPNGSLLQDTATGILYGMTSFGGAHNYGIILKYDPSTGLDSDIHDFDSVEGKIPLGNLFIVNSNTLYGMTSMGGHSNDGVIFKYNPRTHFIDTLYHFNDSMGSMPTGALTLIKNKLYGMTSLGGANDDGVIFSLDTLTNTYTDLLDFNYTNGSNPYGSLLAVGDSILYGMAENGVDSFSEGVLFSFNPNTNIYSILFTFVDSSGGNPSGSLIQAHNGLLYGTTQEGGLYEDGVLFSYNTDSLIYKDVYDLDNAVGGTPCGDLVETPTIVTGIAPTLSKIQFIVYPNPSKELVNILSPDIINEVRVTDLYGRLVYTSTPNQNKFTIDIKQTGMYFVTLISGNQIATNKIIITN